MKFFLLVSVIWLTSPGAVKASASEGSVSLWATSMQWTSGDSATSAQIEKNMRSVIADSRAYDPDCLYGKAGVPCEKNPNPKLTEELDAAALDYAQETEGNFNVQTTKDGKTYRDFGGMVQGFILNKIKPTLKSPWAGNFGGDVFVSAPFPEQKPLAIEDPEVVGMNYATVTLGDGWMLGSSSPEMGSKIRNPKTQKLVENSDFHKIVLFAKSDFDGGRLDAWSTALIVGGKELLFKLWALKKYEGQWGYFYIDRKENPVCSKNLTCDLFQKSGSRTISVKW